MKIEIKNNGGYLPIEEIVPGGCFEKGNKYYMRIFGVESSIPDVCHAVRLYSGEKVWFDKDVSVLPVKAKVVVG